MVGTSGHEPGITRRPEVTAADRQAAAARQRRNDIALWRWALTEPAMDPALTSRQRGAVVRDLASREHQDPDGRKASVSRRTIDRWIVARREGGFDALIPSPRQCPPRPGTEAEDLAAGLTVETPARTAAPTRSGSPACSAPRSPPTASRPFCTAITGRRSSTRRWSGRARCSA